MTILSHAFGIGVEIMTIFSHAFTLEGGTKKNQICKMGVAPM
jgi:hypothetical protein